jgi:hypothetical protein
MITLFSRCTRRLWSAIVVYRVFAAQTSKQVVGSTEKLLGGVRNGEVRHKWSRHDTAQRNTTQHNTTTATPTHQHEKRRNGFCWRCREERREGTWRPRILKHSMELSPGDLAFCLGVLQTCNRYF